MTTLNLEVWENDPLDLIVRRKDLVRNLREHRIDSGVILVILRDLKGLKVKIPVSLTKEQRQRKKRLDTAIRDASSLIGSEAVSKAEKKTLEKMQVHLKTECQDFPPSVNVTLHPEEKKSDFAPAKTLTQALGFQVVPLFDLLSQHAWNVKQRDIFELIAELFEIYHGQKYTWKQISYMHRNNA